MQIIAYSKLLIAICLLARGKPLALNGENGLKETHFQISSVVKRSFTLSFVLQIYLWNKVIIFEHRKEGNS